MSSAGTLSWFAQHECRLAWRDWLAMMTAGGRRRKQSVAITGLAFLAPMHLLAFSMVGGFADLGEPDKTTLVVVTGCALLSWSLMVSQALETVTRSFYARADLDLILSSPVKARKLFAVRMAMMALSVTAMATLLAGPFINVLAALGGPHWLFAYGVVAAFGALAGAFALALTIALFRSIGPKRTRLVAPVIAAVIGAALVIGLQIAAILSTDTLSRFSVARIGSLRGARARSGQLPVVAGSRNPRRSRRARRGAGAESCPARRHNSLLFEDLRRSRDSGRKRRAIGGTMRRSRAHFPFGLAPAGATAQGMDAADA